MDTQFQAVKCLDNSSGSRRFVFKSFSRRIQEINIDVLHSLDPVKPQPVHGSTFLLEALVHWRELNTAEDFISFYHEMMPFVQTLPQVLLHRDKIFSELLSRLHMNAKLSIEPILMLTVALSRDILEEFLPFLKSLVASLADLLENGGERDPEILEKLFTSWSYIMMHLQKYLVKDILFVLKISARLRFFPKDYVQEFIAESLAFLFRNSTICQLRKGIGKVIREVGKYPSPERKHGAVALLFNVMRGTYSKFHTKAEIVLPLLLGQSIFKVSNDYSQGSEVIYDVITRTLLRIFQEIDYTELSLVYDCLCKEITFCVNDGCIEQLNHLLDLLTLLISQSNRSKISYNERFHEIAKLLVHSFVGSDAHWEADDSLSRVVNRILRLLVCLLDVWDDFSKISSLYAPIFKLRNKSLLTFIRRLILKDSNMTQFFRNDVLRSLADMIEASTDEVLFLMLIFFDVSEKQQFWSCQESIPEDLSLSFCRSLEEMLCSWDKVVSDILEEKYQSMRIDELKWSNLWGTLCCYPHFLHSQGNFSLLQNLTDALDKLLQTKVDSNDHDLRSTWESLLSVGVTSIHRTVQFQNSSDIDINKYLNLAKRYNRSPKVLVAVADFLDYIFGSTIKNEMFRPVFQEYDKSGALSVITIFSDNLSLPCKITRVSTLRILSHYAPLVQEHISDGDRPHKKLKTEESGSHDKDNEYDVIKLLLLIEMTPISIATSRQIIIQLSKLHMGLTSSKIDDMYIPLLFNALIGILHNRFSLIWEPAMECLSILMGKFTEIIWDNFSQFLSIQQSRFLASGDQHLKSNPQQTKPNCLDDQFQLSLDPDDVSTPCVTVLSLLLKTLQKLPDVAQSNSKDLIPLFLNFLGYTDDANSSIQPFNIYPCKQKEWNLIIKEWLNVLRLMHNARALYKNEVLKKFIVNRLLDEIDPDIQLNALDCLLNWRDNFLIPYKEHLKNLIVSKNLREELTTWNVSKESNHIQDEHRESLIPIIVRLLTPKVRKLKALGARKHTGVNHRRAVLSFLAQLDVNELPLFYCLLLSSLFDNAYGIQLSSEKFCKAEKGPDGKDLPVLVKLLIELPLSSISWKKRYSFLHVLEDILRTFDEFHIKPFLNLLMSIVVHMLESCMLSISGAYKNELPTPVKVNVAFGGTAAVNLAAVKSNVSSALVGQYKDLRSLCLKIIAFVLNKYDSHDFGSDFWDIFFSSVKPLVDGFKNEGSSSEKPSSLFSCFLSMSRSPTLVLLLNREGSLVSTIFSILTVRTTSDAIISSVLSFIENLLNMDDQMDAMEDIPAKMVLLPHLEVLISSLHSRFRADIDVTRNFNLLPGWKELRIFKQLLKYIKDPCVAEQFIDIVLPFFKKKSLSPEELMEGLHVLEGVVPLIGDKAIGKVLKLIQQLLLYVGLDLRLLICNILHRMSMRDASLVFLANVLQELNAVSSSEMGELDYDRRLKAHESISSNVFSSLREEHVLVLLSHCVYDLSSEELVFRQSASISLLSFIQFSVSIINKDTTGSPEIVPCDGKQVGHLDSVESSWTKPCAQQIIKKIYLQNMAEAMGKDITIQKEWIPLLRSMVYSLEGFPMLNALKGLCSDDAEIDFFNNILHLQIHRRVRALARFRNVLNACVMPVNVIKRIFVPLFLKMLFDVKDGKREHLKNACIQTLSAISRQMQWDSYRPFLMRCLKEITLSPDKQKVLFRLLNAILDNFHFSTKSPGNLLNDAASEDSNLCLVGQNTDHVTPTISSMFNLPDNIEAFLQKRVLPKMQMLLTEDSDKVDVHISLAVLKLLKLLPVETMESHIPSVIHRISNFLKHHLQSIRDEARQALAACLKELGPAYLRFVVEVLKATLKRGYELHVLGYTLNFLLSNSFSDPITGFPDYCLEELLCVVENDILGDVAAEKEVDKIASKMKETRRNKSFETLKLIAQSATFRTHAMKLVSHVSVHLQKVVTTKTKVKLGSMLHHIALGIGMNPSVNIEELLVFVYGLLEDNVTDDKQDKEVSALSLNGNPEGGSRETIQDRYGAITVFSLSLLMTFLKRKKEKSDTSLLALLDPFVNLLCKCLNSKYEDVLSGAVRCLTKLVRMPLSSLDAHAETIKLQLLDFSCKSGNPHSPLVQSSLKLLTLLLQSTKISLPLHDLRLILQLPLYIDLLTNPSPVALGLLKSIVKKKLVVPEIYDLVVRVSELMVTSQSDPIRRICREILLQFLLDYQLSHKRKQQHMDFLITNLRYVHPSGRETVLEMLRAVLSKFPRDFLEEQATSLFMQLVVSLSNERDNNVRLMVATVLKELFVRTSPPTLKSFLKCSLLWYRGDDHHLSSAASQVLGLLVDVCDVCKDFKGHINNILEVLKRVLESSVDFSNSKESDANKTAVLSTWRQAYYSLTMLDRMLMKFPELYEYTNLERIWEIICKLLLHPYSWLRDISSRLVSLYFAAVSDACKMDLGVLKSGKFYLINPCRLFTIAVSYLKQLRLSFTDEAACEAATMNLVFTLCGLHSHHSIQKSSFSSFHEYWSTLDLLDQSTYFSAFDLLGSRKARNNFLLAVSGSKCSIRDYAKLDSCDAFQSLLVAPLFKNLDKIALQMDNAHIKLVFNFLMMIASQIGRDGCREYAIMILLPIYRACEGYAGKVYEDDIKQLAQEARDKIRDIIGVESFVHFYNEARKMLKNRRDKRRQKLKVSAVLHPLRHAQRKRRIAEKHRANKKRRMESTKERRRR